MGGQQSSPRKPLPPTPAAYNGLFSTPRKPKDDFDDSSAGETPRSPEPNDEGDSTLDNINLRSAAGKFDNITAPTIAGAERERASPVKDRPDTQRSDSFVMNFLAKAKDKLHSPGRGEMHRPDHTGAIEKRVSRRRKKDVDRRVARRRRHSISDSGDDNEQAQKTSMPQDSTKPHWFSSAASFIVNHPTLPYDLSQWAQLFFNLFLILCCGYLVYCLWSAVQGDIDKRAGEVAADVMADIAVCATHYRANNCDPKSRMPALETACSGWEKCMKQDAKKIGRAKVSASVFAEIYNSFIEPISWKAMIFTFVLVFGCFAISNLVCTHILVCRNYANSLQAFSIVRSKTQQYGYNGPPVPPTPQRSFSGQNGAFYPGTPWHQPPPGAGFEPQPSAGFGQIEGQGSPIRRLIYN